MGCNIVTYKFIILLVVIGLFSFSFINAHNYNCVPSKIKATLIPTAGFTTLTGIQKLPVNISKGTLIFASEGRQVCK